MASPAGRILALPAGFRPEGALLSEDLSDDLFADVRVRSQRQQDSTRQKREYANVLLQLSPDGTMVAVAQDGPAEDRGRAVASWVIKDNVEKVYHKSNSSAFAFDLKRPKDLYVSVENAKGNFRRFVRAVCEANGIALPPSLSADDGLSEAVQRRPLINVSGFVPKDNFSASTPPVNRRPPVQNTYGRKYNFTSAPRTSSVSRGTAQVLAATTTVDVSDPVAPSPFLAALTASPPNRPPLGSPKRPSPSEPRPTAASMWPSRTPIGPPTRGAEPTPRATDGPRMAGFRNIGNSCYVNAVLQALLAVPPFVAGVADASARFVASGRSVDAAVLTSLGSLAGRRIAASGGQRAEIPPETPEAVLRAVSRRVSRFRGYKQEDAHEFLAALLDCLAADCRAVAQPLPPTPAGETATHDADVTAEFSAEISHSITCMGCAVTSSVKECTPIISLDLPDGNEPTSISAMLGGFFRDERLEYRCERCGNTLGAVAEHRLSAAPRVLVLHVKRFRYDTENSLHDRRPDDVSFPLELTVDGFCTAECKMPASAQHTPEFVKAKRPLSDAEMPRGKRPAAADDDDRAVHRRLDFAAEQSSEDGLSRTEEEQLEWALRESLADANRRREEHDDSDKENRDANGGKRGYRLAAGVFHLGQSAIAGHYVCDAFDTRTKKWLTFDDASVRETTWAAVSRAGRRTSAYLLLYVRE